MAFMANDVPGPAKDERQDTAEVGGAATHADSAAGVLAMAQRLHEEHVAEGQETRQRLITEGQSRHDQLIAEATARQDELLATGQAKRDALISEAEGPVAEAQRKGAELLQELESKRSMLRTEIEELQTFERDHRTHLKSYLEGQLRELEETGTADESR